MNIIESMRKKVRYTTEQVAKYLGVDLMIYLSYERLKIDEVPYQIIELLATLYHVTEYEILTETAQAHSITDNPQQEADIIPFMKIIENYLLMSRLLDVARHDDPRYRIAWNHDGGHRRMTQR